MAEKKVILVLGAGRSSSSLIAHLLGQAGEEGWEIHVGDLSLEAAKEAVEAAVDHLGQDEFRAGLVAGSEESIGQVLESDGVELVDHGRLLLGLGRTGIRRRPPVRGEDAPEPEH